MSKVFGLEPNIFLEIPKGEIKGHTWINKFGRSTNVDQSEFTDIWDGANPVDDQAIWLPPTAARIHDIASAATADVGTVVSSGTLTGGSDTTLLDTGATFSSDGVAVDDIVLNDTRDVYGYASAVAENTLTVYRMHDFNEGGTNKLNDNYRVVTPASTGVAVLHIHGFGLDANFDGQEEFVVLNGTTSVPTTKSYLRIPRMGVHCFGDSANLGTITATATTDATVTAQINAGASQTKMAIFTIPNDTTGYMTGYYGGINRAAGQAVRSDLVLIVKEDIESATSGWVHKHHLSLAEQGSSYLRHPFQPYLRLPEKTDVKMAGQGSANNLDITAGFDLILVDNNS